VNQNNVKAVLVRRTKTGNVAIPQGSRTAEEICQALPELNAWGFQNIYADETDNKHEQLRAELLSVSRPEGSTNPCVKAGALKKLLRWLGGFEHSPRWTSMSSYSLKHIFERETGVYVTEGLFILGALMAGFTAGFWSDYQSAQFKMRRPAVR
jgi:hypothetical protein